MSADFLILLSFCVLGLMAHGSRYYAWLGWVIRALVSITFLGELLALLMWLASGMGKGWEFATITALAISTGLVLYVHGRRLFSWLFTTLDQVVSGQIALVLSHQVSYVEGWQANKIFDPESMPHLAALWIYVTVLWSLLGNIKVANFAVPNIPIPIPLPLDQLFTYNGLGLILLAACGVGVFVTRRPLEVLRRLSVVKPSGRQIIFGIAIVAGSFLYDYLWSLFTHHMRGNLAGQLTTYNSGSFAAAGGTVQASLLVALATGLCAGIGEETIMRGALQPVFGILPTAILHGLLHGQFTHAPVFILQVVVWSALLGVVRRYTNTTTTMIGHVLYNFLLTFLFAFNP